MRKDQGIWNRLTDGSDLFMEPFPAQTVVEIVGQKRVLIENHMGVKAYSREKIAVRVKYGIICICGCELEILRMTKEQLVVQGQISGVSLMRREQI